MNYSEIIKNTIKKFYNKGYLNMYVKDIPDKILARAINEYAPISNEEEVLILKDFGCWKSGKKGYIITNRAIYSSEENYPKIEFGRQENASYIRNLATFTRYGGGAYIKNIPDSFEINEILLLHEIHRRTSGKCFSIPDDILYANEDGLKFPDKCLNCLSPEIGHSVNITMEATEPDKLRRYAYKLGIPGLIIGKILGGNLAVKLFEFYPFLCPNCAKQIKNLSLEHIDLGWCNWLDREEFIPFDFTNYISLSVKSSLFKENEIWLQNTEYANSLFDININKLSNKF